MYAQGAADEFKKKYNLDLNCVQLEHRGMPCSKVQYVFTGSGVDWKRAYDVFSAHIVIDDIDRVRIDLLGRDGKIFLFGQSGGAILVCQYLADFSQHVDRAFVERGSDNLETVINRDRQVFLRIAGKRGSLS